MTPAEITLRLPADSRFVATARVTTASLAAELDFSIDEIEELRVAANELVAVLIEYAEDHGAEAIDLVYRLDGDTLEMRGRVEGAEPADRSDDPLDALTSQILDAVVDEHEFVPGAGMIRKRRAAA